MSLFIGVSVMSVSFVVGVILGLAAAYFGGLVDVLVTRVMDLIMSVPDLVLAILAVAVLGPSLVNTIVAVTIVFLPRYVRLVRASAATEMDKDYVTAAKVAGVGPFRMMVSTILPNCLAPADRSGRARPVGCDPGGGGARLSRPRRPTADARMGLDARRRPRLHPL